MLSSTETMQSLAIVLFRWKEAFLEGPVVHPHSLDIATGGAGGAGGVGGLDAAVWLLPTTLTPAGW